MEVLVSNIIDKELINNSIKRILTNANQFAKQLIETNSIIITTSNEVGSIYKDSLGLALASKGYAVGYGASVARITHDNKVKRLIILNLNIIRELDVTDVEIDAIISHELGHVLNSYPAVNLPLNISGVEKRKQSEFYADYFCKCTGTEDGLLLGMEKFMSSKYSNNEINQMFEYRKLKFQTDEHLIGVEMPKKY